jgi:hypothetical protein
MREKSHAYLLRNLRASIKSGTHSREFQWLATAAYLNVGEVPRFSAMVSRLW